MSFSVTLDFKEISIANLILFYREIIPTVKSTSPKTLVILHGWNQKGAETWQEIMGKVALQHPDYHIIAPDLPGMGESQPPRRVWHAQDYADFIQKFIESKGVKEAYFLGHSFGGAIASIIASQSPTLCSELILLAPAIVRPPLSSKQRWTQKITSFGKQCLEKIGLRSLVQKIRKIWYKLLGSSDYLKTEGIMKDIMAIVVREDLTQFLPDIKCPTIIVWGKEDSYTPIWQLDIIRRKIPQNHVYVLENVNHGIHLYAKKALYEILKKALR
jgi:pimeloyl-ACP methyl ester carboxylesterase